MLSNNENITVTPRNTSKNVSDISLTHKHVVDLFGEVKTVFLHKSSVYVNAIIYEKGNIVFREMIDIKKTDYKISGVPYKIAVANVQNALVAKLKAIMHEVALQREVVPDEEESFTKMLENACRAFPNLSREQGMHLVLDALKAKRRRQLSVDDEPD